ncbi:MAG: hypothetical protein Q7R49_03985 [Candidatus Daviesbacteria bacterium]|nr:hypothetical protein [Candidatus Daviesbacteria bacterium]
MEYQRIAAAFLLGLSLTACKDVDPVPTNTTAAPIVDTNADANSLKPLDSETTKTLIDKYYPESKTPGMVLKEASTISVRSKTLTRIFNFTNRAYNPDVIYGIYNYFEGMVNFPEKDGIIETTTYFPYNIDGQSRLLALVLNPTKDRLTFLVPENSPKPTSWGDYLSGPIPPAITRRSKENTLTYMSATNSSGNRLFRGQDELTTLWLAVEGCQQTAYVVSMDQRGNHLVSSREDVLAQEIVCNSLGYFVAARYMNIPYSRYSTEIKQAALRNLPAAILRGHEYPFIVFSEDSYDQIPVLGSVFK